MLTFVILIHAAIFHASVQQKLSLLACVSIFSDWKLQELNLQQLLGNAELQIQDNDYSILSSATICFLITVWYELRNT